jgi:putative methanogenesis marker protein 17
MKDYARLEKRADGIHVTIHDETYATDLLKMLWDKFGKDKVTQIDRWESVIPSDFVTLEELQEMVIAEPGKRMMEGVLDAVVRIIPEGFRIGHLRYENGLTVIASENPVQEDWVRIVRAALAKPPKPLPPKELEKVKRKLKEEAPPEFREGVKPWKTPFTEVERR